MSFLSLIGVEFKKMKRSKILLIFLVATAILWIPSILNIQQGEDKFQVSSIRIPSLLIIFCP